MLNSAPSLLKVCRNKVGQSRFCIIEAAQLAASLHTRRVRSIRFA
jgi:hypothetical protein